MTTRRQALRSLLGAPFAAPAALPGAGTAVFLRIADRRILRIEGADLAGRWLALPGSTIKPFSLLALIQAGKLTAREEYVCPRALVIAGRSLPCSHPVVPLPMNAGRAIAYSCNCAVAHFAQRFAPDELSQALIASGLASMSGLLPSEATGEVRRNVFGPTCQLQALGEDGIWISPLELLSAYRRLAMRVNKPCMGPIVEGLEGAVEFGTAQGARLDQVKVAGKTGSVITESGAHAAWFAGFAPSRTPQVAIVVLVQGRSGGADAAPVAGRMLREHFADRS